MKNKLQRIANLLAAADSILARYATDDLFSEGRAIRNSILKEIESEHVRAVNLLEAHEAVAEAAALLLETFNNIQLDVPQTNQYEATAEAIAHLATLKEANE